MSIIKWLCRRYMDLFLDRWEGFTADYVDDDPDDEYDYLDNQESLTQES